jgi:hypothetical protein
LHSMIPNLHTREDDIEESPIHWPRNQLEGPSD